VHSRRSSPVYHVLQSYLCLVTTILFNTLKFPSTQVQFIIWCDVLKHAHWTADVTMHSSQHMHTTQSWHTDTHTHTHTGHWLLLQ